jgi:Putative transcriptional regulator
MNIDKLFQIQSNTLTPRQGQVLISEPFMNDFYFGRAVIFLVEHNEKDGSFGVIVNKPASARLNDIVNDFPDFDAPVFLGGPVSCDHIFYLHTIGDSIPESVHVTDGIYWGGNLKVLKKLMETGAINNEQIRFYLGYSGWGVGQLKNELKSNSWIVSKTTASSLLGIHSDKMWKAFVNKMGDKYQMWRRFPENPCDN